MLTYQDNPGYHIKKESLQNTKDKKIKELKEAGCVLTRKYIRIIQVAIKKESLQNTKDKKINVLKEAGCVLTRKYIRIIHVAI